VITSTLLRLPTNNNQHSNRKLHSSEDLISFAGPYTGSTLTFGALLKPTRSKIHDEDDNEAIEPIRCSKPAPAGFVCSRKCDSQSSSYSARRWCPRLSETGSTATRPNRSHTPIHRFRGVERYPFTSPEFQL